MNAMLNVEQFDLPTKIQAMEQLWASLTLSDETITQSNVIPKWHDDVLQQRLQALENGKSEFMDWQTAKERLRAVVKWTYRF